MTELVEDLQLTNLMGACLTIVSTGDQFDIAKIAGYAPNEPRAADMAMSAIQVLNDFVAAIPKAEKPKVI